LEKHKDSVSIPDLDFLVNMTSFWNLLIRLNKRD
jgi:hypothetical protein